MFYGDRFIFDGVSCEEYGLMLYNVGSAKQSQTSFASNSDFSEDRIARRYDPLFYGVTINTPMSFPMTFGLNPDLVDQRKYLDRWDFERIASWLTGLDGYRWLEIIDAGLEHVRYKCRITDLQIVEAGIYPQVMSCKVTCDSPFAYLATEEFTLSEGDSILKNRSTYNGMYYPKMEIGMNGESSVTITNNTTGDEFTLSSVPSSFQNATYYVDNQNQIITMSTLDNPYPYFSSKHFIGLKRGDNNITITGDCSVKFICDFPVNVGG